LITRRWVYETPRKYGEGSAFWQARVRGQFPKLPVVIASGYGRSGMQGEGLQFISKPYSAVDLQQALDHAGRMAAAS